ncbi:MAG: 3-hydroxyacyl-CoA dehydrogenase family protein [Ilumatobacteraceae bacterium]|nr:3-hydroxyacyl-CoA dehydrogenase family protein [Ilumatobacteraceae bacterium]
MLACVTSPNLPPTHPQSSSGEQDALAPHTIGILGSGIMGAGIAEVFASAGHSVVLRSRTAESASDALRTLTASLEKQVQRGRLEAQRKVDILALCTTTTQLEDLKDCDVVIESVVEDLETKVALFAELDSLLPSATILASNTSTLPIIELARSTQRPDKVCGIHFFNPATTMSLVEVVRAITSSDDTIQFAVALTESCGKTPVHVRDDAGFIVNALLFPYLNNAIKMYERGTATMSDIDTAMKGGCNFPMGPFALLDLVGLDTSLSILETLHKSSPNDADEPAPLLRQLVSEGKLGRKTKNGFYSY